MKRLKRKYFLSVRNYLDILRVTPDIDELCITRNCIEDITRTMWGYGVITYNTLKNIRALASAIVTKRILDLE